MGRLSDRSLAFTISLTLASSLLLMAVLVGLTLIQIEETRHYRNALTDQVSPAISRADDVEADATRLSDLLLDYVLSGRPRILTTLRATGQRLEADMAALAGYTHSPREQAALRTLRERIARLRVAVRQTLDQTHRFGRVVGNQYYEGNVAGQIEPTIRAAQELQNLKRDRVDTIREHLMTRGDRLWVYLLIGFFIAVAGSLLVARILIPMITVPARRLVMASRALEHGDYDRAIALGTRERGENAEPVNEIARLQVSFVRMAQTLHEREEQEFAISRAIQTSLLPADRWCSRAFEIVARSDPAWEVGGDFYNIFPLRETRSGESREEITARAESATSSPAVPAHDEGPADDLFAIVLGDVSGKRVQGAMYMTVATTLLEAQAQRGVPPEEVLAAVNAHLYPKIHRLRMFVTVFYGVLDVATGTLDFASAGQVPPVLAKGTGPPRYLQTRGIPLGAFRSPHYERYSVRLLPGHTVVVASDGLVEARNQRGDMVGYDGFLQMVSQHVNADPRDCIDGIFQHVSRISGGREDQDDRTLVVIRHHDRG